MSHSVNKSFAIFVWPPRFILLFIILRYGGHNNAYEPREPPNFSEKVEKKAQYQVFYRDSHWNTQLDLLIRYHLGWYRSNNQFILLIFIYFKIGDRLSFDRHLTLIIHLFRSKDIPIITRAVLLRINAFIGRYIFQSLHQVGETSQTMLPYRRLMRMRCIEYDTSGLAR